MAGKALDPDDIIAALPRPGQGGSYLLALSGGVDSTALLHILCTRPLPAPLRVLHVHHGLHAGADAWQLHCENLCSRHVVPFENVRVQVLQGSSRSVEAEARTVRYEALRAAMHPGDVLLTAHHQDDQAETLLLQLLRGSGVRGLASMPACAEFVPGLHARPLLGVSRRHIEAYARDHELGWVEDPSNNDARFARNRLRQQIMPLFREGWPESAEMFTRAAHHCAEAGEILDEAGADDLAVCLGSCAESLSIPALLEFTPARRHNLLRVWFDRRELPLPTAAHLHRIETEVLEASTDAMPLLTWPGVELRRYRDQLFATTPLPEIPRGTEWEWRPAEGATLTLAPGCGRLEARSVRGIGLRHPTAAEAVRLRLSAGGERLQLPGRSHHHELKHLLQQAGVPPWVRRRVPLLYYGDTIAAVADRWICQGYEAADGENGLVLSWREPPPGYSLIATSP